MLFPGQPKFRRTRPDSLLRPRKYTVYLYFNAVPAPLNGLFPFPSRTCAENKRQPAQVIFITLWGCLCYTHTHFPGGSFCCRLFTDLRFYWLAFLHICRYQLQVFLFCTFCRDKGVFLLKCCGNGLPQRGYFCRKITFRLPGMPDPDPR